MTKAKTKTETKSKTSRLTPKQEMFCRIYIDLLNGTEAYARAYYPEDPKSADRGVCRTNASKLLAKAHIRAYIDKLKEERTKNLQIDSAWVLQKAVENYQIAMQGKPVMRLNKATKKFEDTGAIEPNVRDANEALKIIAELCGFNAAKKLELDGTVGTTTVIKEDV